MKFRLGYVAMTMSLEDCSPSGAVTYKNFEKISGEQARLHRLRKVASKNFLNTLRILRYNKALEIPVYRLTSKLIPLATHPEIHNWNYINDFAENLNEIGSFIKQNDFRISAHPDHFTVINSQQPRVFTDAFRDLDYHVKLYEAMGLEDYKYKLVLHVGGVYGNKQDSIKRFCDNFIRLPERIRERLILENDDKSYNTFEVLELCQHLKIPMVLDVHHHNCLCSQNDLMNVLPEIFDTWKNEYFPPKIHFSSPKNEKDFRSHADMIDYDEFMEFLEIAAFLNRDFDVMLEAKSKDLALLRLSDELAATRGIRRISKGEFIMDTE